MSKEFSVERQAFEIMCGELVEMDLLFIDRNGENLNKWLNSEAFKNRREFEKKYGSTTQIVLNVLTTKSKKELAFDIIKEKRVDVEKILFYRNLEDYNNSNVYGLLTQEEFDLLKEVLGNE